MKVSAGCANCYAAALPPGMRRGAKWGPAEIRPPASESYWRQPAAWNRAALNAGERHRVFCGSVMDVGEDRLDLDPLRARLWDTIRAAPGLDWLLLTKRPATLAKWATVHGWPTNAWVGTSVEDQSQEHRIHDLLTVAEDVPGVVRFLSCEPLLGPIVSLDRYLSRTSLSFCRCLLCNTGREPTSGWRASGEECRDCHRGYVGGIGWVIAGGESGRRARPMHPGWARSLRDQCASAEVPFFFKQWGEWADTGRGMERVGKDAAGRLLDGVEHNEFPT